MSIIIYRLLGFWTFGRLCSDLAFLFAGGGSAHAFHAFPSPTEDVRRAHVPRVFHRRQGHSRHAVALLFILSFFGFYAHLR